MRLLLVKTSSLGDIIHTFPALTDAIEHFPALKVDWVAEESFQEIPALHPAVNKIIPIAIRRWRKQLFSPNTWKEIINAVHELKREKYDFIIDAQGLVKSSIICLLAKGAHYGYSWQSARDPFSTILTSHKIDVPDGLTAIQKSRALFAKVFDYPLPATPVNASLVSSQEKQKDKVLFLPGTSRPNKKWPIQYWVQLAILLKDRGIKITIPWSTDQELQEALCIQAAGDHVEILPKTGLKELGQIIQRYTATISVDTGLGFLSAAFSIPTIFLWGPTSPAKLGRFEKSQYDLISTFDCSKCLKRKCPNLHLSPIHPPCFEEITPQRVWEKLQELISLKAI